MSSLKKRRRLLASIRSSRGLAEERPRTKEEIPELFTACSACGSILDYQEWLDQQRVCPQCGWHMKMPGQERLAYLLDPGYEIFDFNTPKLDPIDFPGYQEKRQDHEARSGLQEALTLAQGQIKGLGLYVAVLEPAYLMGSLGTYVGEELTCLFEQARQDRWPVLVISASGGARMQEGIFSLMQMAKTSLAVQAFAQAGLLYISLLTNPTMGGVSASFAAQGDIILAEPQALIGFAGPRVIEQTMKEKLPQGFQRAEKLLASGFLDGIYARSQQREVLYRILKIHQKNHAKEEG